MEDSEADVKRKIKKAFCPPNVVEGNPCVTYVKVGVRDRIDSRIEAVGIYTAFLLFFLSNIRSDAHVHISLSCQMLVFPYLGKFEVQRKEANGGDV